LSVDIRAQAIRRLGSIAYAPAVPSLLQCLEHESPKIQTDIVGALRNLATRGAEHGLIANGFTKSLRHSASEVCLSIVIGLGELRKDAVEAVPELIKLIAESDGQLQSEARIALKLIDSEAAANLGIR
jgi:HEAT repeat protein